MKKLITTYIIMLLAIVATAREASTINGTLDETRFKKVSLMKILNGRMLEVATTTVNENGYFGFRFVPEYEGFYLLNLGNGNSQNNYYRFYFKGNETLNVKFDTDSYVLTENNSNENIALQKWDDASNSIRIKAISLGNRSTYVDFFPEVEKLKLNLENIKKIKSTGNLKFDSLYPQLVDFDFAYYATAFTFMPNTVHPQKDDFTAFYKSFDAKKYMTLDLLNLHYGDRFISMLVNKSIDFSHRPTFEQMVELIPLTVLKGQFALQNMERAKSYDKFLEQSETFKAYFVLPEQVERVSNLGAKLIETKSGVPAYQFKFPDLNGKIIGLSDLKGKVVLLDMWATWCGPCRAEEPFWEKLNEEYAGKAVAFVGVSTDKDKAAWEKYIVDKKMKGIQLHAGVGNPLSEAYKVNSIPRYILIDKQGDLVTAESPRPSDPKLKELLDVEIRK